MAASQVAQWQQKRNTRSVGFARGVLKFSFSNIEVRALCWSNIVFTVGFGVFITIFLCCIVLFYSLSCVVMAPKKIGVKGKPLTSQTREIIDNVSKFMENEAKGGLQIPLKNYR